MRWLQYIFLQCGLCGEEIRVRKYVIYCCVYVVFLSFQLIISVSFTLATRTLSAKTHQDRTFVSAETGLLATESFAKVQH